MPDQDDQQAEDTGRHHLVPPMIGLPTTAPHAEGSIHPEVLRHLSQRLDEASARDQAMVADSVERLLTEFPERYGDVPRALAGPAIHPQDRHRAPDAPEDDDAERRGFGGELEPEDRFPDNLAGVVAKLRNVGRDELLRAVRESNRAEDDRRRAGRDIDVLWSALESHGDGLNRLRGAFWGLVICVMVTNSVAVGLILADLFT